MKLATIDRPHGTVAAVAVSETEVAVLPSRFVDVESVVRAAEAVHPDPATVDGVRLVESWVTYPARYKGADTFGPLGPWVVTADDSTANLRFDVAEVISFASRYLALEPGDVIGMGTALRTSGRGGVVQNVDLNRLGGLVEVAIDGIGALSNPVEWR